MPTGWPLLRFPAMGSDCLVVVEPGPGADAVLGAARTMIGGLEARLTRFSHTSEVSRLNAQGGGTVSMLLDPLLDLAFALRSETGGLFDPTLLTQLEQAGYATTFRSSRDARRPESMPVRPAATGSPLSAGSATYRDRVLTLPTGVKLDLGGIAKGWTADEVVRDLGSTRGMLVDMGGDIAASPPGPFAGTWPVGIEHAPGSADPGTYLIESGAIATSTTALRRWRGPEGERHHLIDPRAGTCARSNLRWVTALGSLAARAEVWAKSILIAGEREGRRIACREGIHVVATTSDGRMERWGAPPRAAPQAGPARTVSPNSSSHPGTGQADRTSQVAPARS